MVNDGGPAFPVPASDARNVFDEPDGNKHKPGMSLRDWFAGQALQGCLAYSHVNPMIGNYHENCSVLTVAQHSYAIADAMLKAREVPDAK